MIVELLAIWYILFEWREKKNNRKKDSSITSGVKVRATLISPQYSSSFTTLWTVSGRLPTSNSGPKSMLQNADKN